MWEGYPQKKVQLIQLQKTAIVASEAYKNQFGINSQILIPVTCMGNTIIFLKHIVTLYQA